MRSTKKIQLDFSILNPFYTATDNNRFHLIRALARPLPPSLCSCCCWMPPCPLEVNFLHMINLQKQDLSSFFSTYFWILSLCGAKSYSFVASIYLGIWYNSSTSSNVIISSTRWQNEVRRGGDGSIQLWHFVICKPITITYNVVLYSLNSIHHDDHTKQWKSKIAAVDRGEKVEKRVRERIQEVRKRLVFDHLMNKSESP